MELVELRFLSLALEVSASKFRQLQQQFVPKSSPFSLFFFVFFPEDSTFAFFWW
jgi:hypothetical protein